MTTMTLRTAMMRTMRVTRPTAVPWDPTGRVKTVLRGLRLRLGSLLSLALQVLLVEEEEEEEEDLVLGLGQGHKVDQGQGRGRDPILGLCLDRLLLNASPIGPARASEVDPWILWVYPTFTFPKSENKYPG